MFLGYALPWEGEATEITLGLDGGGSFAREQDGAEQIQMGSSGSTFTPINQPLTPSYSLDERGDVNEKETILLPPTAQPRHPQVHTVAEASARNRIKINKINQSLEKTGKLLTNVW